MRTWLILIALVLLGYLAVNLSQSGGWTDTRFLDAAQGPAFEVQVEKPRVARPLFGLLPKALELKLTDDLRFDSESPGAEVGSVGAERLELRADGWELTLVTDDKGAIAPETSLVFDLELGGQQRRLRGFPADPAVGTLQLTEGAGPDELDGEFQLEIATCESAETGKPIDWPPKPLIVRGRFAGLPRGGR